MPKLRFAVIGCGFWSQFQIAAWMEWNAEVELVALCDRSRDNAARRAQQFGVARIYEDAEALFTSEQLDFVDIITDPDTHPVFVQMAARHGVAAICQKPMAPDFAQATTMLETCQEQGVPFFVHENFRFQLPIRALKAQLDQGSIGRPFKARVSFCSGFPVFDNQPNLAELEQFILTDIGSHVLDICRYLFGEARSLYCRTRTVNPRIKGEDVANVLMEMENGLHCYAEMSYASILEREAFPQTFVLIEGEAGSLELGHDFTIKTTTREGTTSRVITFPNYAWADPAYALVHSSIVDCNRDILLGLQGKKEAETTGADNMKTVQLFFDAYRSAANNEVIHYAQRHR
jgi:predicted dehydrogenase